MKLTQWQSTHLWLSNVWMLLNVFDYDPHYKKSMESQAPQRFFLSFESQHLTTSPWQCCCRPISCLASSWLLVSFISTSDSVLCCHQSLSLLVSSGASEFLLGSQTERHCQCFFFFFFLCWGLNSAYNSSHSTSPIFVMGFFKIGSHKLFVPAGFKLQSSRSLSPK
jgi:hypothetical protein